jgi:hypothetical protein
MKENVKPLKKPVKGTCWNVPKIWEGETVFLLGGGPSLLDVDFDLIKHRKIIAINNAYGDPLSCEVGSKKNERECSYKPRDWVDIVFFADERWYDWHRKSLETYKGKVVTNKSSLHKKGQILATHRGQAEGLEERSTFLAWNGSSGGAAIDLAHHLGASTCVLLGYDMRRVTDKTNWHEDHPAPNKNPYKKFLLPYKKVAEDADRLGFKIINCTPESAIKEFPIMTLEEFLKSEVITEGSANVANI